MDALLTIGYLLAAGFAALFFVVLHRAFWTRFYWLDTAEDEIHRIVCDDGWETRLYRYRGRSEPGFRANPVIVSHGYCANRFNVDFHPRASLARYLNRLGFDTWVIELRGCADATRDPPRGRRRGEVLFEDFVDLDMPAAIRHVMEATGATGVHWVGHSMGGMIALAFAQGPGQSLLKSITAIGSPARLQMPPFAHFLCTLSWAVGWLSELPLSLPCQLLAPFYFRLPFDPMAIRQANLAPDSVRRAMTNVLSDMPMGLTRQLARMQTSGGDVVAADDDRNFTAGLSRIEAPLLCIAGSEDNVAPPRSARLAVERASSARKAWMVLGADGSDAPAYGHGDLLIGDDAYRHVFVHVAAWVADIAGVDLEDDAVEAAARAELEVEPRTLRAVPWVPPPPSAARPTIPAPPPLRGGARPADAPWADQADGVRNDAFDAVAESAVDAAREPAVDPVGEPTVDPVATTASADLDRDASEAAPARAHVDAAQGADSEAPWAESQRASEVPDERVDGGMDSVDDDVDGDEPGEIPGADQEAPRGKIDAQAQRLLGVERRDRERRAGEGAVADDRRSGERRRVLRRTPPPGWETTTRAEGTGRTRPARLHRSPVSGDALADALRLAAGRADRVVSLDVVAVTGDAEEP